MQRLLFIGLLVLLAGCSASNYQKYNPSHWNISVGGYDDYRIAENQFSVSFQGNQYTPKNKVQVYGLRRCAEVTSWNGFTHFKILIQRDMSYDQNSTSGAPDLGYVSFSQTFPAITYHIECYKDNIPEGAIDAKTIINQRIK